MPKLDRLLWVTGARGFLGRHVSRSFSETGFQVAGIGRGDWSDHAHWGIDTWVEASVVETSLAGLMRQTGRPDIVFHAAGTGSVHDSFVHHRRSFQDTVVSTFELIEFLRNSAPRCTVLYPSSCAVYGQALVQPIPESAAVAPVSVYGAHKAAAEALLQTAAVNFGLPVGIIRYFSLYGQGLRKQLLWDLGRRLIGGESPIRLGGTGAETRDLLHIDDAVLLAALVAGRCTGEEARPLIVNGGSGRDISVAAIADLVSNNISPGTTVEFTGDQRPGDPTHYQASIERAQTLGFSPRWDTREGITDYCRWLHSSFSPQNTGDGPDPQSVGQP